MAELDFNELGRRLGGWRHKDGQAAEYKASGSNYRTYRPLTSTNTAGELSVSTKIDHIRGGAQDDHCQLDLLILPSGELAHWQARVQIQGSPAFDTGLVGRAAGLAGPKYGAIATAAADVLNSVSTFITGIGEHGGRAAFPGVIRMNLDHIAACVRTGFRVYGAIGEKYAALGGASGLLGAALTDETATPDGIGRYNHFQNGSIYWTQKTGAFEVHGAIRDKWAAMGWERSFLGYPITDETGAPDGKGRFNHFQHGSIYWSPKTGAHEVHGSIRDHWASLGWERSALGYPVSDETDRSGGGRSSRFQGGAIHWTPERGAWVEQPTIVARPKAVSAKVKARQLKL